MMLRGSMPILLVLGLLSDGEARSAPEPVADCDAVGCFQLTMTGFQRANVSAGSATYSMNDAGDLEIVLTSVDPTMAIVISRYSQNAPSSSEEFSIDTRRCENEMDDELDEPAAGSVQVNALSGSVFRPDWMALGSSGKVTLARQGDLVVGRLNVKACGAATSKDNPAVAVTLAGSFKARPR